MACNKEYPLAARSNSRYTQIRYHLFALRENFSSGGVFFMTRVDFALITIRQDEFEAVLLRFPTTVYTGPSGRTYGLSTVPTKTGTSCSVAVVRVSEQGNDAAQQVAHDVIRDLDPQLLLVVGIAGGVPSDDFTLGDVIISSRIDNLNVSKRL